MKKNTKGFTLIELLVVMIIIGILAAIAIPTFLNQRNNGYRTQLKEDLKNTATAIESAAVDNNGDYSSTGVGMTNAYAGAPAAMSSRRHTRVRMARGISSSAATSTVTGSRRFDVFGARNPVV